MSEKTHWDGCWKVHVDCAGAYIDRLVDENERLKAELFAKQKFVDDAFAACNDAGLLRRENERLKRLCAEHHEWFKTLGEMCNYYLRSDQQEQKDE